MENAEAQNKVMYRHRTEVGTVGMSIILNKYFMSILCFMASLGATQWGLDLLGLDLNNFSVLMIPLGITAMLFVILSFRKRDITNGIVLLIMGMAQLTNTISTFAFNDPGLSWQQTFFVIGFATATFIYHSRGQNDKYPSALLCLTILVSAAPFEYANMLSAAGYWICGMSYFISASRRIHTYCVKKDSSEMSLLHVNDRQDKYYTMLFNTAGILSFSILAMFLCVYTFEGSDSTTLFIVKIVISTITMIFGLQSITHGIIDEGIMMFTTSLNMFIFSVMYIINYPEPILLSILTSIINLFLAFKFLQERKKYIFAIISMILFVVFIMEFFFIYAKHMQTALMLLKMVTGTLAICSWIEYETGIKPIGFMARLNEKFSFNTSQIQNKSNMAPWVTLGLLLLWMGLNHMPFLFGMDIDMDMVYMVTILLSIIPLMFVKTLFNECRMTDAIFVFMVSASLLIISVTKMAYEDTLPSMAYIMFFMALGFCLIIFLKRRDRLMSIAAIAIIASYLESSITHDPFSLFSGITYTIAGFMMMFDILLTMFIGDKWKNYLLGNIDRVREKNTPVLTMVPFIMYLISLICLLFTFNDANSGFSILNIFLSLVVLVASFYCVINGDVFSFPVVLMIAVIAITDSVAFLMGLEESYYIYSPMIIIGFICAPTYLTRGRLLLGISCLACSILTVIALISSLPILIWIGFGLFGLVSYLYAVNMWFMHEMGKNLSNKLLFRDLYKGTATSEPTRE